MEIYVQKLIENIPPLKKHNSVDLVLDGGIFNGSYLTGGLLFLKEMEKRKMIKVKRISGASIGSLSGFLYLIDKLELMLDLYKPICKILKTQHNLLLIANLEEVLSEHIPDNICEIVNKKLYITYYCIPKRKKIIKSTYTNKKEIINCIIRSCFFPYLINGEFMYQNKYIDGMNPYIFKAVAGRRILYLDLFGMDKIQNIFNIKNEKTNIHRALSGILDIHNFFIKESNTNMCSYVDMWNINNNISYIIKYIVEILLSYICYFYLQIKIPKKYNFVQNIIMKINYEIFVSFIEYYCD